MKCRIEFTSAAERDIFDIALRIADDSVDAALRWEARLRAAVLRLRTFPRRCPIAPDSALLGTDARQLVHGSYRILFEIDRDVVWVLRVRHGARRRLGEEE